MIQILVFNLTNYSVYESTTRLEDHNYAKFP